VPAEDDRRRRADTSLVGGERPYGARAATFFASSSPPLTVEVARLRHRLVEFVLGPAAEAVQQLPDHTGIGHRPPPLLGGAPGGLRRLGKPAPTAAAWSSNTVAHTPSRTITTANATCTHRAGLEAVAKPGCCLGQVDRQLPRVEVGALDQAAADRGLGNQHRQAEPGGLPAGVRPPIPRSPLPADAHARSAAASRCRSGFQLSTRRMAAAYAAASSSARAVVSTSHARP
jgi:hypothetical protein